MPVIIYKGKKFILRWKVEWDFRLLVVANRYREGRYINWKRADREGALHGLPNISTQELSRRIPYLVNIKYNPNAKRKRYSQPKNVPTFSKKADIFRVMSKEDHNKFGKHKHRQKWSFEQKETLLKLTRKYHRGKVIDWVRVMQDPQSKIFPETDLSKVRKYYSVVLSRNRTKKDIIKRREQALEYKRSDHALYLKRQSKYVKSVTRSVNDLLYSNLEYR